MKISKRVLAAALATTLGCGAVVAVAQTSGATPGQGTHQGPRHGGPGRFRHAGFGGAYTGELLRALHQVERQSPSTYPRDKINAVVKAVFEANKPATRPAAVPASTRVANVTAVWEHGASAPNVSAAQGIVDARLQRDATLANLVYNSLNQFSGLQAAVVNQLQTDAAKADARRQQWQQAHPHVTH